MLHVSRTAVVVEATVADELVEQNMGYLPWVLGENLAEQVQAHVERHGTGYYPALDYFRTLPESVDPALITLTDEVVRFCGDYARRELRRRLSHAFSKIAVEKIQSTAYSMPRVRPAQGGARQRLARHYSPNVIRLDVVLSRVGAEAPADPDPARSAAQQVLQQGHPAFESLDVLSSRPTGA